MGNDIIETGSGTDFIDGGSGNDVIDDRGGDNVIDGEDGNDTITLNGSGNNAVEGGTGDDTITAGRGDDIFIFSDGDGDDTMIDFADRGNDVLILSGVAGASWSQFLDDANQVGDNVVYDTPGGDSITFLDVELNDLTKDLFAFDDSFDAFAVSF